MLLLYILAFIGCVAIADAFAMVTYFLGRFIINKIKQRKIKKEE